MLLNATRIPARVDGEGNLLRLQEQDRARWNQGMIARGMLHLARSAAGEEITEYHSKHQLNEGTTTKPTPRPVPLNATSLEPLSVTMCRLAVFAPALLGSKVIFTVRDAPGAKAVCPVSDLWMNSAGFAPVSVTLVTLKV